MLSEKHKTMLKTAVALDMARITPDLEISGMTTTNDITDMLDSGKTRLYTDEHVATIVANTVIRLAEGGLVPFPESD